MYVIIGRDQCNFCDAAKALLAGADLPYTELNIQKEPKGFLTLFKQAGHTTVPQIYSPEGSHIGGYVELKELLNPTQKRVQND